VALRSNLIQRAIRAVYRRKEKSRGTGGMAKHSIQAVSLMVLRFKRSEKRIVLASSAGKGSGSREK